MADVKLKCIDCNREMEVSAIYRCEKCNGLLDVVLDLDSLREEVSRELFDSRLGSRVFPYQSGVWRFRELVHPLVEDQDIVSKPEGNTNLYRHRNVSEFTAIENIILKHEGENPTGSFKDRGMSPGISEAIRVGMDAVACASTGNTSASMTSYAAYAGIRSVVFIPEGEIAFGKLSQALAHGAQAFQIKGNFDDAMSLVQESSKELGLYLLNSINPWRIEGQKSIMFELLQQLGWKSPDWLIVPAGNLGNTSAFGKAFDELLKLELVDSIPRIASIQAEGANPFYRLFVDEEKELKAVKKPETIASAIKIGNPISWKKAIRAIKLTDGLVEEVSDQEIMDAKAVVDASGIGCEPASAASVAGARKLQEEGMIDKGEKVACIITGNILKDPDATIRYHLGQLEGLESRFGNSPQVIEAKLEAVKKALGA